MKKILSKLPPAVLYIAFALMVLVLLAWSSLRSFQEADERQASVQLPDKGWVTITFRTLPFPPRAGESTTLTFSAGGGRGEMVSLDDTLSFTYGLRGDETPLGEGQARWDNGFHAAEVVFAQPGEYWLRLTVQPGYEVRFLFPVEK